MNSEKKTKRTKKQTEDAEASLEQELQKALEVGYKISEHLKLDAKEFTFHPESNYLEKAFSAYCKKIKHIPTYSNAKTINVVGGRLLYSAICSLINAIPNFNTSGCALWEHCWERDNIKCYHGQKMSKKDNIVELLPSSEKAIQALKDGTGTLSTGRQGKKVVKIIEDKAVVCDNDVSEKSGQYASNSCGLSFTDYSKAMIAMQNAVQYTKVVFPKSSMEHILFIIQNCFCNYAGKSIVGRQLPKMIPFSIKGVSALSAENVDPVKSVTIKYPVVFVFQCCNAYAKRGIDVKSCDFKISYPDLIFCLTTVRQMWMEIFKKPMKINFNEFKWNTDYQVKNVMLPSSEICNDDDPFGTIPCKKSRLSPLEISSSGDSSDGFEM
uniref:DNA-binding protein n=1 Tax=Zoothera dauma adenovirus TaxID=3073259 RepID=A0AA51NPK9_9ADEN|nr:DNA-binding protein [Zoothera dauma adenovirus]